MEKVSMDKFIGQLTIEDLACLVRGEGMGSKRGKTRDRMSFGGVSSRLLILEFRWPPEPTDRPDSGSLQW